MRFQPALKAVLLMEAGKTPQEACEEPLREISKYYPTFTGGMVCVDKQGNYGAAGYGWTMSYSVFNNQSNEVQQYNAPDIKNSTVIIE